MNIIIVGVDGSGKSTLVKKIHEKYNFETFRFNWKDSENYQNNTDLLLKHGDKIVFDRCYLVDRFVYNNFENTGVSTQKLNLLKGSVILFLDTDLNICLERIKERGETTTLESLQQLRDNYCRFFEMDGIKDEVYLIKTEEELIQLIENNVCDNDPKLLKADIKPTFADVYNMQHVGCDSYKEITLAMMMEVCEVMNELDWKYWKSKVEDESKIKEELADVLIFAICLSKALGMNPDDLIYEIYNKTLYNRVRPDHDRRKKEER